MFRKSVRISVVHWVTTVWQIVEVPSTEIERFEPEKDEAPLSEYTQVSARFILSVTCKLWKLSANLLSVYLQYIRLPNKFIYLFLATVDKIYLTPTCHLTCLSAIARHQAFCNGDVHSRNTLLYNIQCRWTYRTSWHHICWRVRRARHRCLCMCKNCIYVFHIYLHVNYKHIRLYAWFAR